ncbi:hypothetical protein Cni_G13934 [Canna indica]|uniref:DUF7075 domain-containing protein n=1 Tax=Canna indica TaxID=4628 RepID=A0AAQ3KFH7_9LILI|nr:hypothetical protein Cni_G13934 [Canna indica]
MNPLRMVKLLKDVARTMFYRDYRRFHPTINARKRRSSKPDAVGGYSAFEPKKADEMTEVVGEPANDTLTVIDSEVAFRADRYLIYMGGGDHCKSMNHYLWSFLYTLDRVIERRRMSLCLGRRQNLLVTDKKAINGRVVHIAHELRLHYKKSGF